MLTKAMKNNPYWQNYVEDKNRGRGMKKSSKKEIGKKESSMGQEQQCEGKWGNLIKKRENEMNKIKTSTRQKCN